MNVSRATVQSKASCLPEIRFDLAEGLTSYSGLVIFAALFKKLKLRTRLKGCFSHLSSRKTAYQNARIFLLLVVHILLGFRRLRGLHYYRHDPLVAQTVGLKRLLHPTSLGRSLRRMDEKAQTKVGLLFTELVCDRLTLMKPSHITLDFDGTVQSTTAQVEGSAIGYNRIKKGARSYYPLFCTIAQTSQFLDMLHRPGNVHDSKGSTEFMLKCADRVREAVPNAVIETRMDGAFFAVKRLKALNHKDIIFTCTVPMGKMPALKAFAENDSDWHPLDDGRQFKEVKHSPSSWKDAPDFRFILLRTRRRKPFKGPLQLDLFEPLDPYFEFSALVTNDMDDSFGSLPHIIRRHHGRGAQERLFGEAKQHAALGIIATKRKIPNRLFTIASMAAINLTRELQIRSATERASRAKGWKRRPCWIFPLLGTLRQRWLHRAGRLVTPQGKKVLALSANFDGREEFLRLYDGASLTI